MDLSVALAPLNEPARYFPVEAKPFSMRAGLIKFPTDFGNGDADRRLFQVDTDLERALAAKRTPRRTPRYFPCAQSDSEREAVAVVQRYVEARLAEEAPERLAAADRDPDAVDRWDALGRALQEDLVVMHEGEAGAGKAILLHVSFPSGWHPEHLPGADFLRIHVPVPTFPGPDGDPRAASASQSMIRSMIDRGPYVRFVWTVRADDALDHHPTAGGRTDWTATSRGYLRVERQLTVPFPEARASLFVIRTYVYPFDGLGPAERDIMRAAIVQMPDAFKSYKGIPADSAIVLGALGPDSMTKT